MENNPFQSKPFQLKNSPEFIEAVKYDKFDELENLLRNPNLLFSYDYLQQTGFHWAAKRNKLRAARTMLIYGNCVNLFDINKMTPLALAAKNNKYEMCQLLCENGANPWIANIDGKRPCDLTTDMKIKSYLLMMEENYSPGLRNNEKKKKQFP